VEVERKAQVAAGGGNSSNRRSGGGGGKRKKMTIATASAIKSQVAGTAN
jgi:hypothetical protein